MKKYLFVALVILIQACSNTSGEKVQLEFTDPSLYLSLQDIEPTDEEREGVVLRLQYPSGGFIEYYERIRAFANIQNEKGIRFDLTRRKIDRYKELTPAGNYLLASESIEQGRATASKSEVEMTDQGAIVRFISGESRSHYGTLQMQGWSRSPIFPDGPVSLGDEWSFEETISARVRAAFLSDPFPEPYQAKGTSKLVDFTEAQGRRCAVIESIIEKRHEERLRYLFSVISTETIIQIKETSYFDYERGVVIGKVIETHSVRTRDGETLADEGRSQILEYLVTAENRRALFAKSKA